MRQFFDTFWHKTLQRPYRLHIGVDRGQGTPVVLLHGLGRSHIVWHHLVGLLCPADQPASGQSYRVLVPDLLGFGRSPKPEWPAYNVDDHARSVIAALQHARLGGPVILVGHSMGCLVAVRVAHERPDLVRHLILYEMPLFAGLPDKRRYRIRLNFYKSLYQRLVEYKPNFNLVKTPRVQRLAEKILGYTLAADVWPPFVKSLQNTILNQTTHEDIKRLPMPMDVIYGTRDRVVIRGKTTELFGEDSKNITGHTVRESHGITKKGSQFLLQRIEAAATEKQP